MALTVISNFAANVAHRNLTKSDMEASRSLAQLSSGQRVVSAKDDAASMAIGSRFRAEVAALQAARVNAGQATSMLQVAEGAMGQVDGILVRMKTLAIQAASSQYGSVERGLIDTEYQQLLLEVDRIAEDTEFNGAQLLDGGALSSLQTASDPNNDGVETIKLDSTVEDDATFRYSYDATNELFSLTKMGVSNVLTNRSTELFDRANLSFSFGASVADDAVFTYNYDNANDLFTLTNLTTGDVATLDVTSAYQQAFGAGVTVVPANETLSVEFSNLGVTVNFEQGFDFNDATFTTVPAAYSTTLTTPGTGAVTYSTGLSEDATTALATLLAASPTPGTLDINVFDDNVTIDLVATPGLAFAVDGGTVSAVGGVPAPNPDLVAGAPHTVDVYIDVNGTVTQVASVVLNGLALNNDMAETITLDFRQRLINTQSIDALQDQTVQIDITDDMDAIAGAGNNLQFDQSLAIDIAQFGVSLTLDKGFDRTVSVPNTIGTTSASAGTTVTAASFATNTNFLTADVYQALLDIGFDAATGVGYNATTGVLSLQVSDDNAGAGLGNVTLDGLAGLSYGFGDGNPTGDLTGAGQTTTLSVTMADGSLVELGTITGTYVNTGNDGGTVGPQETIDIQIGRGVFFNQVDPSAGTTEFTFKIGTANESSDDITLTLNAVNIAALGLTGSDLGTKENADSASIAVTDAVASLNKARANIGALQNRLDIASSNLAVSLENTEAARSQLLDLDVAQEITNFTSKQILMQAGVSMLAQANQLPQNLLRLFQ